MLLIAMHLQQKTKCINIELFIGYGQTYPEAFASAVDIATVLAGIIIGIELIMGIDVNGQFLVGIEIGWTILALIPI